MLFHIYIAEYLYVYVAVFRRNLFLCVSKFSAISYIWKTLSFPLHKGYQTANITNGQG